MQKYELNSQKGQAFPMTEEANGFFITQKAVGKGEMLQMRLRRN